LDAKQIIDIDIIFPNLTNFAKIKLALEQIGYYHNGNQDIENRAALKNGKLTTALLDKVKHPLMLALLMAKYLKDTRSPIISYEKMTRQGQNISK
jgi:GrpB-like predicted nucleotidyltransferase (UPF0157 family)